MVTYLLVWVVALGNVNGSPSTGSQVVTTDKSCEILQAELVENLMELKEKFPRSTVVTHCTELSQ